MRIAVYGGSFNPPHVGHAMVASWLVWTNRCEEVWLLPVHGHPFAKDLRAFDDRVDLCERLAKRLERVRVCTIERELPVPSYTIDTLGELSRRHPEHRFRLVVGADVLGEVHRWKDWAGIEASYDPIRVGRQGFPTPPGAIDFPGVSSTEIRSRCAEGLPVDHLVPCDLVAPIARLYGNGSGGPDAV